MSIRNSVTIVASPRPRVGKTLLARLLTDFHLHEGRSVMAFDVNVGEGTLVEFLPEHVTRSTLDDLKGQMALFDELIVGDGTTKIVDLGHASFELFFKLASQFGLAEEARSRGIVLVVQYFMAPDRTSVETYRSLRSRLPESMLVLVHNEMFGAIQYREKYGPLGSDAVVMSLPLLAPRVRKHVERAPFSFGDSTAASLDTYMELQDWLRQIYRQFREFELRILLIDVKTSIRL
jgi:hypothetical protein